MPLLRLPNLYIYQHVEKKVIDHIFSTVKATHYKCQACNRTFRFYRDHQGAVVKAVISKYDNVSFFLSALGCGVGKATVQRNIQGVDTTIYKVNGRDIHRYP